MDMNIDEVELITFDCYGTLIDWESGIVNAFQTAAARDGIKLDADEIIAAYMAEEAEIELEDYRTYRDVLIKVADRVSVRLGWDMEPDRAVFLPNSLPNWQPFPDTNKALERLAKRFSLGILSNTDDDLLTLTRRHFTVEFDLLVTAQQVKAYKPARAHFHEAIARMGREGLLHAAQSYYHDVVPARALDLPVVWVNRKGEKPTPGGPLPTQEVSNMTELADWLGV